MAVRRPQMLRRIEQHRAVGVLIGLQVNVSLYLASSTL